tara:strand:+ start:64 stop:549 length:486 start_codon:yes stop_codon:yes gene_type:complete
MSLFKDTPTIPTDYQRLIDALSQDEIASAITAGYIAKEMTASPLVTNSITLSTELSLPDNIPDTLDDWRNRIFLVWFCFIYEKFTHLPRPLCALEDVFLELQGGPSEFDRHLSRMCELYAGCGAWELEEVERANGYQRHTDFLLPYYQSAIHLLESCATPR